MVSQFTSQPKKKSDELTEEEQELQRLMAVLNEEQEVNVEDEIEDLDADADREAADDELIEGLEEEFPQLVIDARSSQAGVIALQKVRSP